MSTDDDVLLEDGSGGVELEDGSGDVELESGGAVALTLREAVAAWLAGLPALTSVSPRVYFAQPSQVSAYPCTTVQVKARSYGHNLAGADGTSLATVEITEMALRESQCVALADAVRNSADGFRGTQSGVAILGCLLDDEADGQAPPPDGSDQWIYQITLEYRVKHRVPAPTNVTQTNV